MDENDAQLQLKKRARRRLVGAVFFVSVAAVVLPMVMDQEPRQPVHDVAIKIPGQDDKAFVPKFAATPAPQRAAPAPVATETKAPEPVPDRKPAIVETATPSARVIKETPAEKPAKQAEKASAKPAEKVSEKTAEKPVAKADEDAKRAAAILAGKAAEPPAAGKSGEFLILIGAFANEANVRNLKAKLGEQGVKTFTEPLDTPQGRKTRLRAGPFPSRDAAEKALAKMQRIGVSGVVAAK